MTHKNSFIGYVAYKSWKSLGIDSYNAPDLLWPGSLHFPSGKFLRAEPDVAARLPAGTLLQRNDTCSRNHKGPWLQGTCWLRFLQPKQPGQLASFAAMWWLLGVVTASGCLLLPEKYFSLEIKANNKESSSVVHNNSHTFCYMMQYIMYIFLWSHRHFQGLQAQGLCCSF